MVLLSRRNAVIGLCGTLVSGGAARAWLDSSHKGGRSPTRGRGKWTTFGSVAVLASSLQRRSRRSLADVAVHGHHQGGHHAEHHGDSAAPASHGIWSEMVFVDVEVHNGLDRSLLFSPGQFRLRVGNNGPTVTAYHAERPPGSLPAGKTLTTWVCFLAPEGAHDLAVEFTEAGAADALSTVLTPIRIKGVSL